jgi:hypothetical protein
MPRVIVSIKKTGRGSGKSSLTRYIAESKRDPEREGLAAKERRPLFTDRDDRLTYSAADQHLTRGNGAPANQDIIHLVYSVERRDFERLGTTLKERKGGFREVAREAMRVLEDEIYVVRLYFAGGSHLNTENPHTHVAIDRDAVDRRTGLPVRIDHLPRVFLTHYETQPDGSKILVAGRLADAFAEGLDRYRIHARSVSVRSHTRDLEITREVVTPQTLSYRSPYPSEKLVGDWVLAEVALRHPDLSGERREELDGRARGLRSQVAALDRRAEVRGFKPAAAYVEPERMEALLREPPEGVTVRAFYDSERAEELTAALSPAEERVEAAATRARVPELETAGRERHDDLEAPVLSPRAEVFEEQHDLLPAPDAGARTAGEPEIIPANLEARHAKEEPAAKGHEVEFADAPDAHEFGERPAQEATAGEWEDRYILGRAMVARANFERLRDEHRSATEHGDKRRFLVYDESWGRTRRVSEFDIRRRSDARAGRETYERGIVDAVRRQEERHSRFKGELERHEKAIHDHRVILDKTVKKLEEKLKIATEVYDGLHPRARAIRARYGAEGRPLPLPIVTRGELRKIQDRAVAARMPGRVQKLEEIRRGLAAEHGVPSRTDEERARLSGQLLVARAEYAARQSRADSFEKSHHVQRFDVGGRKVSLADVDRQIADASDHSQVFGERVHLLPSGRREARAEVERLSELREQVSEQIRERREANQKEVAAAARMVGALGEIHRHDQEERAARGLDSAGRELTQQELNQLEQHALQAKDATLLRQFYLLEAEHEERLPAGQKPTLERQSARASGREVVGEISLAEAREQFGNFEGRMMFVPVAVKDKDGRERTARLWDFREGTSPFVRVFDRLLESREHRETRRAVEQAAREQHAALKDECERAQACLEVTRAAAQELRGRLQDEGRALPPAAFTPEQIIRLEMYAARHHDVGERARLEGIIREAEEGGHVLAGGRGKRESPADGLGVPARARSEATLEQEATRAPAATERVQDHDEHVLLH